MATAHFWASRQQQQWLKQRRSLAQQKPKLVLNRREISHDVLPTFATTSDCDGIKRVLFYDTDHSTCFIPHRSKEKAASERKRGGKKDESDGVERKCVHSRLILGGRTHWFPARTRVRAVLMQQKHSCLLWQCWLFMSCWFSIVCLGLVWKDVGAYKCVSTCVCV